MRKKKEMSLLIVITMLLMIMAPMPAVAEATNWADYANASAPDDYEVSGYVYTIKTATGLAWLASQVNEGNAFSGMTFQLSGDIDLSAHEWTPIGNNNKSFSGTFDGCNKKISGLAIGSESNPNTTLSYIGLFGEVWPQGGGGSTPEIKNLTIETSGIYSDRTGKPFAEIGILAGRTKATITNCKVSGNVVGTNSYLGGLLGEADGPVNISECSAAGNITLIADAGICGGLIGYGNSIDISKSYAAVGVTYTGDNYAGGLVGHLENINSKVSYCYATGNVVVQPGSGSGHIYACGGLVGFLNGQLLHCYARGDVSGNNKYTGGLIGESNGSVIIAYASGKVTCNDDSKRGAVIGYSRGSSLTYWNDEVYEGANQGIGNNPSPDQNISTGKHQADMQGADFAGLLNSEEPTPVWKYVSGVNDGYPVLIGVGDGTAAGGSTGPTVTLTSDSAGTAGYKKITGLTEGKIYKVTVDPEGISPETMYTKADGSLTANEADKEALGFCVTAITGLTNGTTYKVEEYNTPPAGSEDYTITKSGGSFQVGGAGTYATLAAALAVCTEQGADNKLVIKLGDGSNPLELNACKNSNDNNLKAATYTGKVNFTITSNTTDGFTIPNGITATFEDLAITTSVDSPPFSAIKVMQGGILNIEEGTSITPHFAPANPRLDLIANVGEFNINGGTITGDDNTGLLIRNYGSLTVSGGTITTSATGNYGVAITSMAGGNVTVSDNAVISAPKYGIAAEGSQSADQIVINGGTVEATGASGIAIMTRGAKVDVTAGTVRSTDTSSWACAIGDISSNVINSTITISGGTISCAGDTAIRVGNTSLGTVNVSGGTIKSAGDKTLLLFQHASTPDNAKFVVHGVSIYRHNEAFVSIKGVVDPADNNNRVLTGANKNDATVTAINIASGKSFIGWMSDSARAASISTTNGATITSLTTGDNAAVSDIYLKVGVLVSAPTVLPTAGSFTDTDNDANQIGGTITWTAANPTTDITGYKIYWGSNATTKLAGNSAVVYTVAGAASTSQAVADNTDLPAGATHFLIYSYNTGGDSASCLAIAITDGGPAQAVTLAAGSLGAAGDGKITNLTSGSRYKVSVDGASKYVKADGTLSDNEADAAALIGTEITGLTNGTAYKVEEYSPLPTNPEVGSTITFAGMDWICISTEPYKLVLKDLVRENGAVKTVQYNVYNQDVYTGSMIDTWLNGTFLDSLGDDADNIQAVDWNCGPDSNISSIKVNRKVGLLNYVEVFSNNAYNKHLLDSKAPVAVDWWLLTPRGFENNNAYAWYMLIGEDGKGYGNPFMVTGLKAIRPLIYLKDGFTFNLVGGKYEAVAPAANVILSQGSLGLAGDGKITNLVSGSKYKVSVDGAIKYVKADGTLSDNEADAAALIGTEITGLTNGTAYKVEEYSPLPTNPEVGSTITFAGMDWICISTEPYKLILKDLVRENGAVKTIQYNSDNQDIYNGSTIDTWLNGTFLNSLGDDANNIEAVAWNCGPDSNTSSIQVNRKVGLLNYDDLFSNDAYNKHLLDSKAPVTGDWWLITPRGFENNNAIVWYMLIAQDGKGYGNICNVAELKAIRPQIYLEDGFSFNLVGDKYEAVAPAANVILSQGSLGLAGDGKITNLVSGSKYQVSVDGATKYVKADGTLSDHEADAAALIGTEIIGLTNGKNYKVEEYTGGGMSDADAVAGAKAALDESDITYSSGDSKTSVTGNFTMPLTGENGTTITWTENPESSAVSINPTTGVVTVTRPANGNGDAIVTLRATITRNGQSDNKDLTITVKQQTGLKLTVPDFSIENQTIAEGVTKQITLSASGSKLIVNQVEQTAAIITYSYIEVEDTGNIAELSGSTLTLSPPADGSAAVKIKATAAWAEGGSNLTASRIASFTVRNEGNPPCCCIVTPPAFSVNNQTIPYDEDKVVTLNASGAKLIGNCQIPGHAAGQINYTYTILSGSLDATGASIASINGNQLTLNPTIAGTYAIMIQTTASANNKTAGKTASFAVSKQPGPAAADCKCDISAPVLAGGNITIPAGANNANLDLIGQLTAGTITGGCQLAGHANAIVNHVFAIKTGNSSYNTAGASLNGTSLTVTNSGSVTVIATAFANSKLSQTAEAMYNVSDADVSAVENQITALPLAGSDTPGTDDTEINNAAAAILAAKTAFENLSTDEKEQLSLSKRSKLDTLINRLGVLQTGIDASQAGAAVTATGLETAVNTTNELNAGSNVNITLAVQAEANSSNADETAADGNLIITSAGSNQNLSSAFDIRLLKTVTESSGNVTTENISEADAPVYVTLELPAGMQGGRDYKVYHVHTKADGSKELEIIEATYNANAEPPSISFWIREFSTIKIAYTKRPGSSYDDELYGGNTGLSAITPAKGTEVYILVNGKAENAGTATTAQVGDQTVTTVLLDPQILEAKLSQAGMNAVLTIPVNSQADVVIGQLTGQMIKNLENKQAVVEIKTETAVYTLPAQQINIDAISAQLGQAVALKDIMVQIEIAKAADETAKMVENSAKAGEFTIVAPPVAFKVQCSFGDKTVSVNSFNNYVERTIAIPEGADPNKITTGVAVEADGSIRHVPTQVIQIDGRYYAKINSLTNSSYAVIWHPLEFRDVDKHWAKAAVNDMGSRMVISGINQDNFEPDRDITRAEFAAIIVQALGLKSGSGEGPFSDVNAGEWYSGSIQTGSEYKIISGYGNEKFGPTDKISREQAMSMIARAMNITGLKADFQTGEAEKLLAGYSDAGRAAEYAKNSLAACVKTGIITGKNKNMIAPKDNISRAEVAVMVQKLLQKSKLI